MKITDKKKFKRALIIFICIIIFFASSIIIKNANKKFNTIEDFSTVKEALKYLGCTYIRTEYLLNDEYEQKIYVKFNKELYENDKSNERFFNNLVQIIAKVNDYKSTILIDTTKNINIKIKCNRQLAEFNTYYINNIENYFAKQDSKNSIENEENREAITKVIINSDILKEVINKKWNNIDINFGTKESDFEGYNIFFDEGIKVKTIGNRIFNIVFDENYKEYIVNNIKTSTSIEDIQKELGKPTYNTKNSNLIGYKTDNMYIFFSNNEISVYRIDTEDITECYSLIEKFAKNEININTLIDKITTQWIDYDNFASEKDYIKLTYTLKGIEIQVTPENKDGIHIYSNYKGLDEQDLSRFIESGKVYIDTKVNLVFQSEATRIPEKENLEYTYISYMNLSELEKKQSSAYYYKVYKYDDGSIYKVGFLSKDNQNPSNELKEQINSYVWYNDNIFLYGKSQDGIYAYDVINREKRKILSGKDNFKIKGLENNRLKYDDKSVELKDN